MSKQITAIRNFYRTNLAAPGWRRLLTISLTVAYLLSPIDILPELLPILGFTDDAALFFYFMRELFMVFVLGKKTVDDDNPKMKKQQSSGRVIDAEVREKTNV
jgi:uncharacterized membrane protein YkvA (DUF1232 family)